MTSEQETIQETETADDATKSSTELAEKAAFSKGYQVIWVSAFKSCEMVRRVISGVQSGS